MDIKICCIKSMFELCMVLSVFFFFFQAEDGIRDLYVTGVQTCALPILAERSSFLEVAYLLIHGELPDPEQRREWVEAITHHTLLHENIKKLIDGFHHDAHPMGVLVGTVGALSTFYPDAKDIFKAESRRLQILRLIAKMPTLAAFAYRHAIGMPFAYPDNDLSYSGNFLNMMWKATELKYEPNPVLER